MNRDDTPTTAVSSGITRRTCRDAQTGGPPGRRTGFHGTGTIPQWCKFYFLSPVCLVSPGLTYCLHGIPRRFARLAGAVLCLSPRGDPHTGVTVEDPSRTRSRAGLWLLVR